MHYNAFSLPFVLEFFTDGAETNTKSLDQFWGRNEVPASSIHQLMNVKESIQMGVRLYAKEDVDQSKVRKVIIQTSTYDEDGKQKDITIPATDRESRDYVYRHDAKQEFPWRLGVYFLEVHFDDMVYASAIFVTPIHLSSTQVQHMHLLLEQEIEGISFDLIYTTKSTSREHELLKSMSYYDYVLRLVNEKERINASLIQLERKLLHQVKTDYIMEPFQRRVDQKSLRWKDTRGSAMELNKKKNLNVNIPPNRWMKHILISWKNDLLGIERLIENDLKASLALIHHKEEEKRQSEARKNNFWNAREISRESRDSMSSRIYRLEDEIKKAQREFGVLNRWNNVVKNAIGRFTFMLTYTALSEAERGQKKPPLKDRDYRMISDLYEDVRKVLIGNGASNHIVQILKPTWKIYEQFVYFQVIHMLKKHGFHIAKTCNLEALQNLESGFCIELENTDWIIHVWYDRVVNMREDAAVTGDHFFSASMIQPDVRIDLYSKGKTPVFISSIALDAKHRKYKALHNNNFTSIVFTQLSKYQNIYYTGINTLPQNRRRSVVDRVFCLYSRDPDADIKREEIPLVFIQLFPDLQQGNITGYDELYSEFSGWLDEMKHELE